MRSRKRCKWGLKLEEEHNEREAKHREAFLSKPHTRKFSLQRLHYNNSLFIQQRFSMTLHYKLSSLASDNKFAAKCVLTFVQKIYSSLIAHFSLYVFLFLCQKFLSSLTLPLLLFTHEHFVISSKKVFSSTRERWRFWRFLNMTLEGVFMLLRPKRVKFIFYFLPAFVRFKSLQKYIR